MSGLGGVRLLEAGRKGQLTCGEMLLQLTISPKGQFIKNFTSIIYKCIAITDGKLLLLYISTMPSMQLGFIILINIS